MSTCPSPKRAACNGSAPTGESPGAACNAAQSSGGRTRRRNCPVRRRSHTRLSTGVTLLGASSGVQVPAARCGSIEVGQPRGASNFEGRSQGRTDSVETPTHQEPGRVLKADCGDGDAKRSGLRDGRCARRSNWAQAGERSPGVDAGRQSKRDWQPKQGRSRGSPRALPPSEDPRYKRRRVVKSAGAGETGGSGRSSGDERDMITLLEPRTRGAQWRGTWGGLFRTAREGYSPG
jgi:hypothetical protein